MWLIGFEKPCIYSVPIKKQSYDDEDKLVDVIYHEGVNESDLKILSDTLVNACTNTSAEYKGFHFNK